MGKAVMYGAGNIGRGFVGMLFAQSGYEVVFIDVAEPVVTQLNKTHTYPVRIVSSDFTEDIEVAKVAAVDGRDADAAADAIADADIMATAVDTCQRVGRDAKRKLDTADRLIGAASLCVEKGVMPAYILSGAAAAVYEYLREQGMEQSEKRRSTRFGMP